MYIQSTKYAFKWKKKCTKKMEKFFKTRKKVRKKRNENVIFKSFDVCEGVLTHI